MTTLRQLDTAAEDFDLPCFDNVQLTVGRMRATGLAWAGGGALVFERVAFRRAVAEVQRDTLAFGAIATTGELDSATLLEEDQFRESPDPHTVLSKITGIAFRPSTGLRTVPAGGPRSTASLTFDGRAIPITVAPLVLAGHDPVVLRRITPEEVAFYQLCDAVEPEAWFADDAALAALVGASGSANVLFRFDDWQHPDAGVPASSSPDLVAMAAAVDAARPLGSLPGKPNGRWREWAPRLAPGHAPGEADAWGP